MTNDDDISISQTSDLATGAPRSEDAPRDMTDVDTPDAGAASVERAQTDTPAVDESSIDSIDVHAAEPDGTESAESAATVEIASTVESDGDEGDWTDEAEVQTTESLSSDSGISDATEDDAIAEQELLGIVEALVFASEESLSASRICDIIAETTGSAPHADRVDAAVDWLNALYARHERSFRIQRWGGGFRMATDPRYAHFLKAMYFQHRETKLSRSLLESLAIIAYRQPCTKPEVDHIRGVDSDYAIRRLMELDFVEISGRSEGVGKPLLYRTTELFMDKFGLSSLEDLPTLREIEELLNDPTFSSEKAHLLIARGLDLSDPSVEEGEASLRINVTEQATTSILQDMDEDPSGDGSSVDTDADISAESSDADADGS